MQKLILAGHTSRTVGIPAHGDPAMTNSLIVGSSLAPGDVVSQFVAWGDFQVRTVELQAKDSDSVQNGGGHPWTIEPGVDSTLLLFNHSTDGPKRFNVLINSGKQLWQEHYLLAPMETKAVSIRRIVEKQTPDEKGKTLAKDTLSGQIGWWTRLPKWGKGRLMVSSPQKGLARSYSCGNCAALCNFGAFLDPFDVAFLDPGGSGDLGNINVYECLLTCTQQCGGTKQGLSSDAIYRWTSSDTSIATISGGASSALASFHGVAAGTAHGNFTATDDQCTATGSGQINVKPSITSISPPKGLVGTTVSVTLNGKGFDGSGLSVSAGSGISATINSRTSTQILATFTISSSAAGGNNNVTVTAGGQTSPSKTFYVQIPSKLSISTITSLVVITNGNVLDYFGKVVRVNRCGEYRNVASNLLDQQGGTILGGDFTLTEFFSNYSTTLVPNPGPPPTQSFTQNTAVQILADTQFFGFIAPGCPGSDDHESFDQSFQITLGSTNFPLTTVYHVDRGLYSGVPTVNVTVKTP